MPKINAAYSPEDLHHLPGDALFELVSEMHAAIVGLLWQIEDLKNFDDLMHESHFLDSCPVYRASEIHRLLMTKSPKTIIENKYLHCDGEFEKFWDRCSVGESFKN